MKRILVSIIFLSVLFVGCTNINQDHQGHDESFSSVLTHLTEVNQIKCNVITSEISHYGEVAESLANAANESFRTHTVANLIIERSPLSASSLSITTNQDGTYFGKTSTGHSDKPFYRELYKAPIEDADYSIDTMNNITLTQDFEDNVRLNIERYRKIPELGFHQEGNDMYWTQPFDVLLESASDPFKLLLYLMKQNSESFKPDHTNEGVITYIGQIDPDTMVDYYRNDGSGAFEGLFYGYEGEMTREALVNEMIMHGYSAMIEPFNALLFSDEHMPVTISKNLNNNTYAITIMMTGIQNALYEKMYADSDFPVVVDESIIEYKNIVLK